MRGALTATYLLGTLFFGITLGGFLLREMDLGIAGLVLFVLDAAIGICLQHRVDNDGEAEAKKFAEAVVVAAMLKSLEEEEKVNNEMKELSLCEQFDVVYRGLCNDGGRRDPTRFQEDEAGRLFIRQHQTMQYAPPRKWLTGLRHVVATRKTGYPAILFMFKNEEWEVCQNVAVYLVRTKEKLRMFTVEVSYSSLMLCEYPGTGHINYGTIEPIEIENRIAEILNKEEDAY